MATNLKRYTRVNEKEYVASGDWKCPESPTGAHWWNCNVEPPVCKICGKVNIAAGRVAATSPLPNEVTA